MQKYVIKRIKKKKEKNGRISTKLYSKAFRKRKNGQYCYLNLIKGQMFT